MKFQEVISSMEGFVGEQLDLLKPVKESWQAADFLPELNREDWAAQIEDLRRNAVDVSDETLVVLIGNIITEEALPSYQTWLNGLDTAGGNLGTSDNPWAKWQRGWTAEENRHGDLLHTYLYLSGRADMRAVDVTIQTLIRNGFDPLTKKNPYRGLVYTSAQERATAIAHKRTGKLAAKNGDKLLEKICTQVANDEVRHETAYKRFFGKVLELDPDGALLAFQAMMQEKVIMPARTMTDVEENDLFGLHVAVTQGADVYTAHDYADVIDHLVELWEIANLKGLSAEGNQAQEFLCGLSEHYHLRAERMRRLVSRRKKQPCPWIFDRKI